ncbi:MULTISPECIES: VOC family protein [Bacillaceae]|uniref:VOC family protein n=1 Tax=Bacillaceae TaxID=186817 RepID=UPI002964CA8B|nr:VOC family protein [Bacillus infantis]MDW2877999.1 VOC family protein [Bacillus infantis]
MAQLCAIGIYVPDLTKALRFYTEVLDFEVNKQYGPKIVSLAHGELPIILEENEGADYIDRKAATGPVLVLQTENIENEVNRLKSKGADLLMEEPAACPPGKYISFRDPFGNILEYLQFD